MSLAVELREAEERTKRLRRAAARKRRGEACSEHEWRSQQSVTAVGGTDRFLARVRTLTGVDLPHPGYHVMLCIVCDQWGITDYCSGSPELDEIHEISKEAALQLV